MIDHDFYPEGPRWCGVSHEVPRYVRTVRELENALQTIKDAEADLDEDVGTAPVGMRPALNALFFSLPEVDRFEPALQNAREALIKQNRTTQGLAS